MKKFLWKRLLPLLMTVVMLLGACLPTAALAISGGDEEPYYSIEWEDGVLRILLNPEKVYEVISDKEITREELLKFIPEDIITLLQKGKSITADDLKALFSEYVTVEDLQAIKDLLPMEVILDYFDAELLELLITRDELMQVVDFNALLAGEQVEAALQDLITGEVLKLLLDNKNARETILSPTFMSGLLDGADGEPSILDRIFADIDAENENAKALLNNLVAAVDTDTLLKEHHTELETLIAGWAEKDPTHFKDMIGDPIVQKGITTYLDANHEIAVAFAKEYGDELLTQAPEIFLHKDVIAFLIENNVLTSADVFDVLDEWGTADEDTGKTSMDTVLEALSDNPDVMELLLEDSAFVTAVFDADSDVVTKLVTAQLIRDLAAEGILNPEELLVDGITAQKVTEDFKDSHGITVATVAERYGITVTEVIGDFELDQKTETEVRAIAAELNISEDRVEQDIQNGTLQALTVAELCRAYSVTAAQLLDACEITMAQVLGTYNDCTTASGNDMTPAGLMAEFGITDEQLFNADYVDEAKARNEVESLLLSNEQADAAKRSALLNKLTSSVSLNSLEHEELLPLLEQMSSTTFFEVMESFNVTDNTGKVVSNELYTLIHDLLEENIKQAKQSGETSIFHDLITRYVENHGTVELEGVLENMDEDQLELIMKDHLGEILHALGPSVFFDPNFEDTDATGFDVQEMIADIGKAAGDDYLNNGFVYFLEKDYITIDEVATALGGDGGRVAGYRVVMEYLDFDKIDIALLLPYIDFTDVIAAVDGGYATILGWYSNAELKALAQTVGADGIKTFLTESGLANSDTLKQVANDVLAFVKSKTGDAKAFMREVFNRLTQIYFNELEYAAVNGKQFFFNEPDKLKLQEVVVALLQGIPDLETFASLEEGEPFLELTFEAMFRGHTSKLGISVGFDGNFDKLKKFAEKHQDRFDLDVSDDLDVSLQIVAPEVVAELYETVLTFPEETDRDLSDTQRAALEKVRNQLLLAPTMTATELALLLEDIPADTVADYAARIAEKADEIRDKVYDKLAPKLAGQQDKLDAAMAKVDEILAACSDAEKLEALKTKVIGVLTKLTDKLGDRTVSQFYAETGNGEFVYYNEFEVDLYEKITERITLPEDLQLILRDALMLSGSVDLSLTLEGVYRAQIFEGDGTVRTFYLPQGLPMDVLYEAVPDLDYEFEDGETMPAADTDFVHEDLYEIRFYDENGQEIANSAIIYDPEKPEEYPTRDELEKLLPSKEHYDGAWADFEVLFALIGTRQIIELHAVYTPVKYSATFEDFNKEEIDGFTEVPFDIENRVISLPDRTLLNIAAGWQLAGWTVYDAETDEKLMTIDKTATSYTVAVEHLRGLVIRSEFETISYTGEITTVGGVTIPTHTYHYDVTSNELTLPTVYKDHYIHTWYIDLKDGEGWIALVKKTVEAEENQSTPQLMSARAGQTEYTIEDEVWVLPDDKTLPAENEDGTAAFELMDTLVAVDYYAKIFDGTRQIGTDTTYGYTVESEHRYITLPGVSELQVPTGKRFAGWAVRYDTANGVEYTIIDPLSTYAPPLTTGVELRAQYEWINYKIEFYGTTGTEITFHYGDKTLSGSAPAIDVELGTRGGVWAATVGGDRYTFDEFAAYVATNGAPLPDNGTTKITFTKEMTYIGYSFNIDGRVQTNTVMEGFAAPSSTYATTIPGGKQLYRWSVDFNGDGVEDTTWQIGESISVGALVAAGVLTENVTVIVTPVIDWSVRTAKFFQFDGTTVYATRTFHLGSTSFDGTEGIPALPTHDMEGLKQTGRWYVMDGNRRVTLEDYLAQGLPNASIAVYVEYDPEEYEITYSQLFDGTRMEQYSTGSYTYGQQVGDLTLPTVPTVSGYTTDGHWYIKDGEEEILFTAYTLSTGDLKVYAKYTTDGGVTPGGPDEPDEPDDPDGPGGTDTPSVPDDTPHVPTGDPSGTYYATFYTHNELGEETVVARILLSSQDIVNGRIPNIPEVPYQNGYRGVWMLRGYELQDYLTRFGLNYEDYAINAYYDREDPASKVLYRVIYEVDGETILMSDFNVDDFQNGTLPAIPEFPEKEGYSGRWETEINGTVYTPEEFFGDLSLWQQETIIFRAVYTEPDDGGKLLGLGWIWWLVILLVLIICVLIGVIIAMKLRMAKMILPVIVPEEEEEEEPAPVVVEETPTPVVMPTLAVRKTACGRDAGLKVFVNIRDLNEHFAEGDTVDLEALKAKGLVSPKAKRLKVLADGQLSIALTVIADSFSEQAKNAITKVGGQALRKNG